MKFGRKLLGLTAVWAIGWFAVGSGAIFPQASAAPAAKKDFKAFDVASVKENKSGGPAQSNVPLGPGDAYTPNGGHFLATNTSLVDYFFFAYKVQPNQGPALLKGMPEWVKTARYDIEARVEGEPGKDDMRMMMRSLLVERFGLKTHTEMQEVPVLDLVLIKPGKLGPALKEHTANQSCANAENGVMCGQMTVRPAPGIVQGMSVLGRPFEEVGRDVEMAAFAIDVFRQVNMGKQVVDKTGLTGKYDFAFEFTPDSSQFKAPPGTTYTPDETATTFMQAMEQKMGMKLVPDKVQTKMVVVDHIERPTEN